jgi:hypothetical protein
VYSLEYFAPKESAVESDLIALFGDWSQSEKLPQIKPPLNVRTEY